MEYNIKITAETPEKFKEIQEKIYSLPDCIRNQIESALMGFVGIVCTFKNTFHTERKFILPEYTTQIENFGDYIGIYAGSFFFKIPKEMMEYKLSYIIKQNEEPIATDLLNKAVEFVKNNQCDVHLNQPYLLIGNVAELITILTGIKVDVETLIFKNEKK